MLEVIKFRLKLLVAIVTIILFVNLNINVDESISSYQGVSIGDTVCVVLEAEAWIAGTNTPTWAALGTFTATKFWQFGADADDDIITSFSMPEYATSIAYWEIEAIANTNSGDYDMEFTWEGYAHDEPVADDLTLANSDIMDVDAPSASGDKLLQRQNLSGGDLTSLSASDLVQCRLNRDADDAVNDDATGTFDFVALKLYFIRGK